MEDNNKSFKELSNIAKLTERMVDLLESDISSRKRQNSIERKEKMIESRQPSHRDESETRHDKSVLDYARGNSDFNRKSESNEVSRHKDTAASSARLMKIMKGLFASSVGAAALSEDKMKDLISATENNTTSATTNNIVSDKILKAIDKSRGQQSKQYNLTVERDKRESKVSHGMAHMAEQNYVVGNQIASEIIKLHSFLRKDSTTELKARLDIMRSDRHIDLKREQRLNTMFTKVMHITGVKAHTQGKLQAEVDKESAPDFKGEKKATRARAMLQMADNLDEFDKLAKFMGHGVGSAADAWKDSEKTKDELLAEFISLDQKYGVGLAQLLESDKKFVTGFLKKWNLRNSEAEPGLRVRGIGSDAKIAKHKKRQEIEAFAASEAFGGDKDFDLNRKFEGLGGSGGGMECCEALTEMLKGPLAIISNSAILGSSEGVLKMGILGGIDELVDIKRNTRDTAFETNRLSGIMEDFFEFQIGQKGPKRKSYGNVRINESNSSTGKGTGKKNVERKYTVDEAEFNKLKEDVKYAVDQGFTRAEAEAIHEGIIKMTPSGDLRGPAELEKRFYEASLHSGSIYTHDIHTEDIVKKHYELSLKTYDLDRESNVRDRKRYRREIEDNRDKKNSLSKMRGGFGGGRGPGGPGGPGGGDGGGGFMGWISDNPGKSTAAAVGIGGGIVLWLKNYLKNPANRKGRIGMILLGIAEALNLAGVFDNEPGADGVSGDNSSTTSDVISTTANVATAVWIGNKLLTPPGATPGVVPGNTVPRLAPGGNLTINQAGQRVPNPTGAMKNVTPNESWIKKKFKEHLKKMKPAELKKYFSLAKAGRNIGHLKAVLLATPGYGWVTYAILLIAEAIVLGWIFDAIEEVMAETEGKMKSAASSSSGSGSESDTDTSWVLMNGGGGMVVNKREDPTIGVQSSEAAMNFLRSTTQQAGSKYDFKGNRYGGHRGLSGNEVWNPFDSWGTSAKSYSKGYAGSLVAGSPILNGQLNQMQYGAMSLDSQMRKSLGREIPPEMKALMSDYENNLVKGIDGVTPDKSKADALAEAGLHKGSIYTNDTHVTGALENILSVLVGSKAYAGDYKGPKDPSGLGHGYGSDPDGSGFWNKTGGKKKPRTKAEQDAVDKAMDKFRDDYNERNPDNKLDWKDRVKKKPGQGDLFDPSKMKSAEERQMYIAGAQGLNLANKNMQGTKWFNKGYIPGEEKWSMAKHWKNETSQLTMRTNPNGTISRTPAPWNAFRTGDLASGRTLGTGPTAGFRNIAKFGSRALPGIGAALGAYDASERLKQGDNFGAALSVGSTVPGWGLVPLAVQVLTDYVGVTGNKKQLENLQPNTRLNDLSPNAVNGQYGSGAPTIINNNNSSSNTNNSSIISSSSAHAPAMPQGMQGYS